MNMRDRSGIRQTAAEKLSQAQYDPRRLVLLHTGAALALTTILTVLNYILTQRIDTTGGLAGLGNRAILETARTMLQYASVILLPFWELGFVFAALRLARGQEAKPESLLEGFRRFFPALRLMLLRLVLYIGVALCCINFGATIYAMTPLAQPVVELLEPIVNAETAQEMQLLLEQVSMETMVKVIWPAWVIFGVLYVLLMIPLLYRLRMAEFVLMDEQKVGAFAAMSKSNRIMRRNCWKLFRLDLDFWWFYLLQVLLTVLCYGDILIEMLGISLPMDPDVRFFLFYLVYAFGQLALYAYAWGRVQTTYGVAYDVLLEQAGIVRKPEEPKMWNN